MIVNLQYLLFLMLILIRDSYIIQVIYFVYFMFIIISTFVLIFN